MKWRRLAAIAFALFAPGCRRSSSSLPSDDDASPLIGIVAAPVDATAPAVAPRDYRGTLGKHPIALHVVRAGVSLSGTYAYVAIGLPIPVDGTVDATGAMALAEKADGKATGTFQLHARGTDLLGQWSDPSGKKVFAVQLSPGAPFAFRDAGAADTGAASGRRAGPGKRAEDCLASPTCAATEAARLFVVASDANDPDLDCFRFLDGMGTARDLPRARACFEHQAAAHACTEGSADMQAAELAMMRIDGIGGKTDVSGGRALFAAPCFDDVTRTAVLEHATAKEHDPAIPAVDFCKDIGGTTITSNECMARDSKNTDTRRALAAKAAVASMDDAGRALFASSEKAYGDYVDAMGSFVYEVYIDGTIRGAMALGEEQSLRQTRVEDLAAFPHFVAKDPSAQDVDAARHASAAAVSAVAGAATTQAEKAALQKTQRTWTAYRDADVALYEQVFGAKQGADRVRAARLVLLESRRAKQCAPPSAGE